MEISWKASKVTRLTMMPMQGPETFQSYTTDRFPTYRIEKWDSDWAVLDVSKSKNGVLCSTRRTLADAKLLLVFLATH
jgi:hypothetical protein